MADADPNPYEVVAEVGTDRAQTVVAGIATADLHLHSAGGKVQLVVEDNHVLQVDFEESCRFADRAPALVHVGHGLKQQNALAADGPFRRLALKPAAPWREPVPLGNPIDSHEADVVAMAGVLVARIAQSDKKLHDAPISHIRR